MQHRDALNWVRAFFSRSASDTNPATEEVSLSGPTLLQQEPDLIKETSRYIQNASGWAAGGHPSE